jgi:hypothetical protein
MSHVSKKKTSQNAYSPLKLNYLNFMGVLKTDKSSCSSSGRKRVRVETQAEEMASFSTTPRTRSERSNRSRYPKPLKDPLTELQENFDVSPHEYFLQELGCRGYNAAVLTHNCSVRPKRSAEKGDIDSYSADLLSAIRKSNIEMVTQLKERGVLMTACNKFCESIIHLACRRSEAHMVNWLLLNGDAESLWMIDDKGRSPLHDAFWRKCPDFSIVEMILDRCSDLLLLKDFRGNAPLEYTQKQDWPAWKRFIENKMDDYFPVISPQLQFKSIRGIENENENGQCKDDKIAENSNIGLE